MEHVLTKLEIRAGKEERVASFLRQLGTRKAEMAELLAECHIELDCSFVTEIHGRSNLFIFKRMNGPEALAERLRTSALPISDEITRWGEECFVAREDLDCLLAVESEVIGERVER